MINALAAAVQGLGFGFAQIAMQGLLAYVIEEVKKYEQVGGGGMTPRRRVVRLPVPAPIANDDDELLFLGII